VTAPRVGSGLPTLWKPRESEGGREGGREDGVRIWERDTGRLGGRDAAVEGDRTQGRIRAAYFVEAKRV